jgi:GTP-binding protein Era
LGERLNQVVDQSMDSVDIVIMCIPADETSGAGDTFIAAEIAKHPKAKKFAVVTKTDLISKEKLAVRLLGIMKIAEGFVWNEIIPVSAAIHDQVDLLNELIGKNLPAGPQYYPEGTTSDQAIEQLICEFIREAALQDVREELPHSIVVTIDEFGEREEKGSRPFFDVHATIHVERDTQRAILLGHQGTRLKEIGIRARADIERALAAKIFLGLHIKVSKEWQKDPKLLAKLGFGEKA